ncbi:hypothetical protein SGFS_033340 [Streptomyces graminofaciens]|uniref:Secreted protein n=1 Tax=Streptomyces graminofaciens TaxID=68212 RepID=A0ABM7F8I8_9ACTN|nr:hypothetical protein [Streptomyces graminofaciens]BBC32040.1 hypothetical protein SGFS_033340 [Streptomyces graminofaciens]
MKHRGRHRRRRRGRALRASLAGTALALTAAATLISTSQAVGGDTPGPLDSITSTDELHDLRLRENLTGQATLDTLTTRMGGSVGVHEVLRSANHTMRNRTECEAPETAALPVEPRASRAYCWDAADAVNEKWDPQSVTTSGDADSDGQWGDDRVVLAGWTHDNSDTEDHNSEDDGLARIAFVDADDPGNLIYRYVLLVAPEDGGKDFSAVRSGLGGMVWYQDKLIVTARAAGQHDNALYVFDLDLILRAGVTDSDAIGKVDEGWSAHHYRYVLPAVGSYSLPSGTRGSGGTCDSRDGDGVPCLSSLSLDRTSTPHSLVASESSGPDREEPTRIWRYDLAPGADHRAGPLAADSRGVVDPSEAYRTKAGGVQGVLSHDGDWYVGQAPADPDAPGTLWRQDEDGAKAAKCTTAGPDDAPGEASDEESYSCWGLHTSALSYWPETRELWTLTDAIPERVLYAVRWSAIGDTLNQ